MTRGNCPPHDLEPLPGGAQRCKKCNAIVM